MHVRATKGKVTKTRRQHQAGQREDHLDVARLQPGAEPALQAEDQHEDQAGDDRRDREGQFDQRDQQPLARESRAWRRTRPRRCRRPVFSGTAMAATSSVSRIAARLSGSAIASQARPQAAAQRLGEHGGQRQAEQQHADEQRQRRRAAHRAQARHRRAPGRTTLISRAPPQRALQQVERQQDRGRTAAASPGRSRRRRHSRTVPAGSRSAAARSR